MSHTRSAEPPGAGLSLSEPQSEPGARTAEPAASSMPLCHGQPYRVEPWGQDRSVFSLNNCNFEP